MNLTSLMDVFTILVFFLIMNSGPTEVLDSAKDVVLPESIVETKPNETVVINVSTDEVLVQGEPVVRVADIMAMGGGDIEPIVVRLAELHERVIGVRTQSRRREPGRDDSRGQVDPVQRVEADHVDVHRGGLHAHFARRHSERIGSRIRRHSGSAISHMNAQCRNNQPRRKKASRFSRRSTRLWRSSAASRAICTRSRASSTRSTCSASSTCCSSRLAGRSRGSASSAH